MMSKPSGVFPWGPSLFLAASLVVVTLAYWIGLSGPFLLDDFGNLRDIGDWVAGERTWLSAVLNNRSGMGGRPLSMLSFSADAALWGMDAWHFKLTNLLLHLACGIALWALARRLCARDPDLRAHAAWTAAALAALWLALPIQVSSVLYVVQRMAILAALFMFCALWLYVVAREQLEQGSRRGMFNLWLGVPTLTGLAFLAKENGALVPLMALVLEIAYFRPSPAQRRPRAVWWFFLLLVALPAVLFLIHIAIRPGWLLDGYRLRDFTLMERLLSQPRILWDYVGSIFLPYGPRLGLFHDNYPKSTGLLSPWTTLVACLAWLVTMALAWRHRIRHPGLLAGAGLFLAAHAMESSVFALELYFEHRNYFASAGLLLMAATLASWGLWRIRPTPIFRTTLLALAGMLLIVMLTVTHGRARVWASTETLYGQELIHNPDSPRLRSFVAGAAIQSGDVDAALAHIAAAERHQDPRQAMTSTLWKFTAYCKSPTPPPAHLYAEADARAHGVIQTYAMTAWEILAREIELGRCPTVDLHRLVPIVDRWTNQSPLPRTTQSVWRTRYYLARMHAMQSDLAAAADLGEAAWMDSGYNPGIGVFVFQVNASLGRDEKCREILGRLKQSEGGDLKLNRAIRTFEAALGIALPPALPPLSP